MIILANMFVLTLMAVGAFFAAILLVAPLVALLKDKQVRQSLTTRDGWRLLLRRVSVAKAALVALLLCVATYRLGSHVLIMLPMWLVGVKRLLVPQNA